MSRHYDAIARRHDIEQPTCPIVGELNLEDSAWRQSEHEEIERRLRLVFPKADYNTINAIAWVVWNIHLSQTTVPTWRGGVL